MPNAFSVHGGFADLEHAESDFPHAAIAVLLKPDSLAVASNDGAGAEGEVVHSVSLFGVGLLQPTILFAALGRYDGSTGITGLCLVGVFFRFAERAHFFANLGFGLGLTNGWRGDDRGGVGHLCWG